MSSVKTSGQLRGFLTGVMEQVRDGKLTHERASTIVKAAGQVNESIYAELKTRQLSKALGEKVHSFGTQPLNDE